jgi:hypothetical protein
MTQAQLLREFSQLPLQQQIELVQAALGIIGQRVQGVQPDKNGHSAHKPLAEAANLLLADYMEDEELTSFTTLDGEPFYAKG